MKNTYKKEEEEEEETGIIERGVKPYRIFGCVALEPVKRCLWPLLKK